MVFVLLTDENTLVVHKDAADAIRACEGIDVEDGICLFFDGAGQVLHAVFDEPNERGRFVIKSGRYRLEPGEGQHLLERLATIAHFEGEGSLRSIQDVQRLLTAQSRGTPTSGRLSL